VDRRTLMSGPIRFTPERIVLCVVLGGVLIRIVTGAMGRFKPSVPNERPHPALTLFPVVPMVLFWQSLLVPLTLWGVVAGCIGLLASLALFEWAVRATGTEYFSWAMSRDVPQFVLDRGPYAYIRNPFYASYLASYVSAAVALQTVVSYVIVVVMGFLFYRVARFEEEKFARSPVKEQYARYLGRTGRFLPRVRRLFGAK
jgi:protein-S-isoprenylcysteine O-methyltransferase Ste14